MREVLKEKTKIILSNPELGKKTFFISGIVGMGHSCIVYDAYYRDELKLKHSVRLKELFPVVSACEKREEMGIVWHSEEEHQRCADEFRSMYKANMHLQEIRSLVNTTCKINDGLLEGNNTLYISMEMDEGHSFDKCRDITVHQLFKYMKALCEVIKKYHDMGLLYLDIKPENFMVIPETENIIKLFDFDSLVSADDLSAGEIQKLSYSNDWAAPEVKKVQLSKICEASDIYSIGLIVFERLYGRKRTASDALHLGAWNFDECNLLEKVNPCIKRNLGDFLNKTIVPTVKKRYQCMDEVIAALDELVRLSDPDLLYLKESIPKQMNYFCGRQAELKKVDTILEEHNYVVLSGMGGIGKTELSIYYANSRRSSYSNIVWVKVDSTVQKMLESEDELTIAGLSGECSSDDKMRALKTVLDKDTLLILDDVKDYTEKSLLSLLQLPCKFMITSRLKPDHYLGKVENIELDCMDDETLETIFFHYYRLNIDDEEKGKVKDIIHALGNYTLLVPIIAKSMALGVIYPSEMYERLNSSGIKSKTDQVAHYKDRVITESSLFGHLQKVFNLDLLSKEEKEVLVSMSLLGKIRIGKEQLSVWTGQSVQCYDGSSVFDRHYYGVDKTVVNNLIFKGWISYDEQYDYVSLHDVIAEVSLLHKDINWKSLDIVYYIREICSDIKYLKNSLFNNKEEYVAENYSAIVVNVLKHLIKIGPSNFDYVFDRIEEIHKFVPNEIEGLLKELEEKGYFANSDEKIISRYHLIKVYLLSESLNEYYIDSDENILFHQSKISELIGELDKCIKFGRENLADSDDALYLFLMKIVNIIEDTVNLFCIYKLEDSFCNQIEEKLKQILNEIIRHVVSEEKKTEISKIANTIEDNHNKRREYLYDDNKKTNGNPEKSADLVEHYDELFDADRGERIKTYENINLMLDETRLSDFSKSYLMKEAFFSIPLGTPHIDIILLADDFEQRDIYASEEILSVDDYLIIPLFLGRKKLFLSRFINIYLNVKNCSDYMGFSGSFVFKCLSMRYKHLALLLNKGILEERLKNKLSSEYDEDQDRFMGDTIKLIDQSIDMAESINSGLYDSFIELRRKLFNINFSSKEDRNSYSGKDYSEQVKILCNRYRQFLKDGNRITFEAYVDSMQEIPYEVKRIFLDAANEPERLKDYSCSDVPVSSHIPDINYRKECIKECKTADNILDLIMLNGEVVFQNILMKNEENLALKDYIELAEKTLLPQVNIIGIINYFKLPFVLAKMDSVDVSMEILVNYEKMLYPFWKEFNYPRLRTLNSYLSDMYDILISYSKHEVERLAYESKKVDLHIIWNGMKKSAEELEKEEENFYYAGIY